jgi:hypothetical protein
MMTQHRALMRRGDQRIHALVLLILPLVLTAACRQPEPNAPEPALAASPSVPGDSARAAPPKPPAGNAAERQAQLRARDWLTLVDQGQYTASWDAAAPLFQSSTTKQQWEGAAQGARAPLGELGKRELRAAEYKTALPKAPAGEYVVVYYDSAFAKKAPAREIVTLMRGPDDSWKVVGYFVE